MDLSCEDAAPSFELEAKSALNDEISDFFYASGLFNGEIILDETNGEFLRKNSLDVPPENRPNNVKKTRKRQADPELWQRNVRKKARLMGSGYYGRDGIVRPMKNIKPGCQNCRLNCVERVSSDLRQDFFNKYYQLKSRRQKWEFLLRYTRTEGTKSFNMSSRRQYSRKFFIGTGIVSNGGEEMLKVCQKMFLSTLAISDNVVRKAHEKIMNKSGVLHEDLRGSHVRKLSMLKIKQKQYIIDHIKSFPKVESHYSREKCSKEFLESHLTISKMYKLYQETVQNAEDLVTERVYRDVFNKSFPNLSFHTLKKDACDVCTQYEYALPSQKQALESNYQHHINKKTKARLLKTKMKEEANKSGGSTICAIFDYQKGIQLPRAEASSFYYKRKLTAHNFTIYETTSKQAYNFVYDESLTGSGPNEVCSCLLKFIDSHAKLGVKEFCFVSDNCPGQNHNQYLYAFYVFCSQKFNVNIQHLFLVRGHTQSEVDNVHSVIERAMKKITIFGPDQLYDIIRESNKKGAHKVIKLELQDILNFKSVVTPKLFAKAADNKPLKILTVCQLSISGNNPLLFRYKYDYDLDWNEMNVSGINLSAPQILRSRPKGISKQKKQDLLSLCKSGLIKENFVTFYNELPEETTLKSIENTPHVKKAK